MRNDQALIQDKNSKTIQMVGNKIRSGRTLVDSTSLAVLLLPPDLKTLCVILKGTTGNTGNIAIGGKGVTSTSFYLDADQEITLWIDNAKEPLYGLAVSTTTDTVHWIAIRAE